MSKILKFGVVLIVVSIACLGGWIRTKAIHVEDPTAGEVHSPDLRSTVYGPMIAPGHPDPMKKVRLARVELQARQQEFVVGEPVFLEVKLIPTADPANKALQKWPQAVHVRLSVERGSQRMISGLSPQGEGGIYFLHQVSPQEVSWLVLAMEGREEKGATTRETLRPLYDEPGEYLLRARFDNEEQQVDSPPIQIRVRAPTPREAQALARLAGGRSLWTLPEWYQLSRKHQAEERQRSEALGLRTDWYPLWREKIQALREVASRYADTPYAPYALFALVERTLQEAWFDPEDTEYVERLEYERAVADAERLIAKYPHFCLRDDVWYALLRSWGHSAWLRMKGISLEKGIRPERNPQTFLPHVQELMETADQFVREYPHSPLRPEVEKMLGEARRYMEKHGR